MIKFSWLNARRQSEQRHGGSLSTNGQWWAAGRGGPRAAQPDDSGVAGARKTDGVDWQGVGDRRRSAGPPPDQTNIARGAIYADFREIGSSVHFDSVVAPTAWDLRNHDLARSSFRNAAYVFRYDGWCIIIASGMPI